ncbi:hypothetical protein AVEN_181788-1 [Araneus ventricosus]|uniref:Uncharacterized protein n=1 Tax=Araneus ventricosus TaxID=182803 RepID=A0A4Y2RWQ9_ARAVE|nr:hypothetical protein AVEN_38215-1 [Araneus ventricosus]GBN79669.1 hypothetical protein AVEN_181788-1 [Araneus ventricosus]
MFSVSHYTHLYSGLDFSLNIVQHAGVTEAQASVMRCRRSCNVGGGMHIPALLCVPIRRNLMGSSQGRHHVGTTHFGVGATVYSQQSRILHPAKTPQVLLFR